MRSARREDFSGLYSIFRSAYRDKLVNDVRWANSGFRVARTLDAR
jgi:formylglycine-generating enzyme required for sulfatase activity